MNLWDWWWILPLSMIVLCILMMVFMMRNCMAKMRHMMSGAHNAKQTGTGMEMAGCPCMVMMGRFMKSTPPAKEQRSEGQ
jgi:hypothetical protein